MKTMLLAAVAIAMAAPALAWNNNWDYNDEAEQQFYNQTLQQQQQMQDRAQRQFEWGTRCMLRNYQNCY